MERPQVSWLDSEKVHEKEKGGRRRTDPALGKRMERCGNFSAIATFRPPTALSTNGKRGRNPVESLMYEWSVLSVNDNGCSLINKMLLTNIHGVICKDTCWQCVEIIFVSHLVPRTIPCPKLRGVIVGARAEDVAQRMPSQIPNDAIMS